MLTALVRGNYIGVSKNTYLSASCRKKHVLDKECSDAIKELIWETCELELVPPGCHCCNIAEVAIKVFKEHFLSVLAKVAPDFP